MFAHVRTCDYMMKDRPMPSDLWCSPGAHKYASSTNCLYLVAAL